MKSPLQRNLENFICMLSQDYEKIDQDVNISTIHKLLIMMDKPFFEHVKLSNWFDVQSLIQEFYHLQGLEINAVEDIQATQIEAGEMKPFVEALIILSSLVKIFNEEHYEEVKDYFQSKVNIPEDQDFFDYVDDVYRDFKNYMDNVKEQKRESMMTMKKQKENEETLRLLNLISTKNDVIHDLQNQNKELNKDIDKFQKKITELNDFLEKNQYQQEESTKNLQMQERIYETKLKLMEEDLTKIKEDYEKRIKKMVTNHDLEKEKVKNMVKAWNEDKATMQKELKKLSNEKTIADKNLNMKNMDITDLKKENKVLANKIKSLEIKTKSSVNWRNRHDKLKSENKRLNELIDELEAKINVMDRQNINEKNAYGIQMGRGSRHKLNLDGLANNITSSGNNEIREEPEVKSKLFHMRESEVDLDIYGDVSASLSQHITENMTYYGPRDTIPAMNMSPINQINLQEFAYDKIDERITEVSEKSPENAPQKTPEDHISMEEAGILYAAVSDYLVSHMDMVEYYTSKKTRERDIMKPFVIEQFFK